MKSGNIRFDGTLVGLQVAGLEKWLDGFWCHGEEKSNVLMIVVHGMGGNFYGSRLKKELMSRCTQENIDVFTFNNRGAGWGVQNERFSDCLADIDAAVKFARKEGYRKIVLLGHSTGCQKITFYQARRQLRIVKALVQLAPGDDYAIVRRDLGMSFNRWVKKAEALVQEGAGETLLPPHRTGFGARRFLSVADPSNTESKIFNYEGPLYHFRKIRTPMLVIFGSAEEFACIPVPEMGRILSEKTNAEDFEFVSIPGADHGFHGKELQTVKYIVKWLRHKK